MTQTGEFAVTFRLAVAYLYQDRPKVPNMTELRTDRRTLLTGAAALFTLAACGPRPAQAASASEAAFASSPIRKISDAEWKQKLPGERAPIRILPP